MYSLNSGSASAPFASHTVSEALPCWPEEEVNQVLARLHRTTGLDFSGYRRPTVLRRIRNRMISIGLASLPRYITLLEEQPEEAFALLQRLTIKVSRFYRDANTFDVIRDSVLPSLAAMRGGEPLAVWSAGCGRGEEAWTLAMLLERAGIAGQVFATDIDPAALDEAARGEYRPEAVRELPADLRAAYLDTELAGGRLQYRVRDRLRPRVCFMPQDVAASPLSVERPFDLVCCRNVLIYFDALVQRRALGLLLAAVREGGYLCLGEAEWPLHAVSASLRAVGRKTQVFLTLENKGNREMQS